MVLVLIMVNLMLRQEWEIFLVLNIQEIYKNIRGKTNLIIIGVLNGSLYIYTRFKEE